MSNKPLNRRDAMSKLMQLVAAAAGISVTELSGLLEAEAQTVKKTTTTTPTKLDKPTTTSNTTVSTSSTAGTALDALKVKLSGYNEKVFESVYGKTTPIKAMSELQLPHGVNPGNPGDMGCVVQFGGGISGMVNGASACPALSFCGAFGGSSCPSLDTCGDNVCSNQEYGGQGGGCMGVNDCNGQDCSDLNTCGDNECSSQNCPNLSGCGKNKQSLVAILEQFKTDVYVKDLLNHFNVNTSSQLALKVQSMINQKQTITPTQLLEERSKLTNVKPIN